MAFDLTQISEAVARNARRQPTEPKPTQDQVIADLRERLAAEKSARQSAEARITSLEQMLSQAGDTMKSTVGRAHDLATQAMRPKDKPVAYDVVITDRDAEGRMRKLELIPKSGSHI